MSQVRGRRRDPERDRVDDDRYNRVGVIVGYWVNAQETGESVGKMGQVSVVDGALDAGVEAARREEVLADGLADKCRFPEPGPSDHGHEAHLEPGTHSRHQTLALNQCRSNRPFRVGHGARDRDQVSSPVIVPSSECSLNELVGASFTTLPRRITTIRSVTAST